MENPSNNHFVQAHHQGSQIPAEANSQKREIGDLAVWTLSSSKLGNGVEQLRDNILTTFWQSDGAQPHHINIQFLKMARVQEVAMYFDFKTDESYTPQKISIRAANCFNELQEIKLIDLEEPTGWFAFDLGQTNSSGQIVVPYIKTMHIQISILANQHSGRDTHVRQIKIFGPREKKTRSMIAPKFSTISMLQYETIK